MIRSHEIRLLVLALSFAVLGAAFSEEPATRNGEATKAPKTHVVKREPFSVALVVDGVIEPARPAEVGIWLDQFDGDLIVAEAVAHGTAVEKGAVLVRLETREIDEEIEDAERSLVTADLERETLACEAAFLARSQAQELEAAVRADRIAREDKERFETVERAHSEESAKFGLQSARNYLEYEQEELKQLERMYKADDLTEETEEIVLRRQRDAVEQADFSLKSSKLSHEETLEIDLPREDEAHRQAAESAALALEKVRTLQPLDLSKKELEVAKKKAERDRAAAKLERLRRDAHAMEVASPIAGIVYHGRFRRGAWAEAEAMGKKLRSGGELDVGEVFLTVVAPAGEFVVRASVPEGSVHFLSLGLEGRVAPAAIPDLSVAAKVEAVSPVPAAPGSFECVLELALAQLGPREPLSAGMAVKARFVPYRDADALVVPAKALFRDEYKDADYVLVASDKDGAEPEKRFVRVGQRSGDRVEILDGIEEGTSILLERPE